MNFEIKRKFLLNNGIIKVALGLDGVVFKKIDIAQFYTQISMDKEISFQRIKDKFIKKIVQKKDNKKENFEKEITQNSYKKATKKAITQTILKNRYQFKLNNTPCYIDIFNNSLSELVIFGIIFNSKEESINFVLPEFFKNYIVIEITDNKTYRNKNLALFGKPDFKFDYAQSLKRVKKIGDIPLFFTNFITTYDGLRLILSQNLISIKRSIKKYLDDENLLLILEEEIQKNRTFLEVFGFALKDEIYLKFNDFFKQFHQKILDLTEITHIYDYTQNVDLTLKNDKITQEKENLSKELKNFLCSKKTKGLFDEYELMLKDDQNLYSSALAKKCFKSVIAYRLRILSLQILIDLKAINYKILLNKYKKLFIILSYFSDILMMKISSKTLYKLTDLINLLQCILRQKQLINAGFTIKYEEKKEEKIIKKRKKLSKNLHKLSRYLKIYYHKEI